MKLNWGILGVAKIAVEKVIPAMAGSEDFTVHAIASRKLEKAEAAARKLGIPKAYGSYEELIADPDIHIIYNPLPNHMHAEWSIKCMEAGKHVLCEKPIALSSADVEKMIKARDRYGVKVGEAFMVRTHPQWLKTRELIQQGALGQLRLIQGCFSYYNVQPENIRNIEAYGGGAIWDLGGYPVSTARFVMGEEPLKVVAMMRKDEQFGTDVLSSVMMQFSSAQVVFSVATQQVAYQRMHFVGEKKELEIRIPFNAPNHVACEIRLNNGDIFQKDVEKLEFGICDQYRIQAQAFSKAVRENGQVPVALEDALANTRVLEAIFQSARQGRWIEIENQDNIRP